MPSIDPQILKFIRKHHLFTLATSQNNEPYVCSCFYTYSKSLGLFIFSSDAQTRHTQEMIRQRRVAGSIALETKIIGKIKGIQFTGDARQLSGKEHNAALKTFLSRFPYVALKDLLLWGIEPDFIKMTNNQLGFGKKLIWQK